MVIRLDTIAFHHHQAFSTVAGISGALRCRSLPYVVSTPLIPPSSLQPLTRHTCVRPQSLNRARKRAVMEAVAPTSASADMGNVRIGGVGRPTHSVRRLVDARQLSPDELAALRAENPGVDFNVPSDMPEAVRVFFTNPSILIIVAGLCALLYLRATAGVGLSLLDLISVPIVGVGWTVQEWAIHKFLLHGWKGWYGHDTHMAHHRLPFYHISIDPPEVVLTWGAVACALFYVAIPLRHIAHTCLCAYWLMGLLYEFAHYIVHTRVRFSGGLGKAIKQHHTRHHLKDDRYWFAFTVPAIDEAMGSVPPMKTHAAHTVAQ